MCEFINCKIEVGFSSIVELLSFVCHCIIFPMSFSFHRRSPRHSHFYLHDMDECDCGHFFNGPCSPYECTGRD